MKMSRRLKKRKFVCMIFISLEPANTRSEDRTFYRTQHTHIFLVARRVAQLFHIARFIQCTCTGSMIDETSQHVCRVLKTLLLPHSHSSISCLVATSWACLSVILFFLTDRRRNRGSPASIPVAVAGLVQWPNSLRSQVMSLTT